MLYIMKLALLAFRMNTVLRLHVLIKLLAYQTRNNNDNIIIYYRPHPNFPCNYVVIKIPKRHKSAEGHFARTGTL